MHLFLIPFLNAGDDDTLIIFMWWILKQVARQYVDVEQITLVFIIRVCGKLMHFIHDRNIIYEF